VILDIPPGAVDEQILIEITDLPCEQVDTILSVQVYSLHKKRCLGAFSAEPDGLIFNVPIKAVVPISLLEPDEIPVLIEIVFDEQKYWIMKTNLTYLADQKVAEIEIHHFTDFTIDALSGLPPEVTNDLCTDPFWNKKLTICEDFDSFQPAECLLPKEERPVGTICCREQSFSVQAEDNDFSVNRSSGACEILGTNVEITYHDCERSDGSGPLHETFPMGELSPNCPEGMTFKINVEPPTINLFACKEQKLRATITGYAADGTVSIPTATFPATWTSLSPEVANFTKPDGTVKGLKEGQAQVQAGTGEDPGITPGKALVNVMSNISLTVTPTQHTITVGDGRILEANVLDAQGNPLDASAVTWSSSDPDTAYVTQETGEWTSVEGIKSGTVTVTATYNGDCALTKSATITVGQEVEQKVVSVEIDPNTATLDVDETVTLLVMTNESGDCPSPISWTIPPGGIIAFDPESQVVRGVSEGTATITATCEGVSGSATITVKEQETQTCSGAHSGVIQGWGYLWYEGTPISITDDYVLTIEDGTAHIVGTLDYYHVYNEDHLSKTFDFDKYFPVEVTGSDIYGTHLNLIYPTIPGMEVWWTISGTCTSGGITGSFLVEAKGNASFSGAYYYLFTLN
jgi:uncharacterized protein YjdB